MVCDKANCWLYPVAILCSLIPSDFPRIFSISTSCRHVVRKWGWWLEVGIFHQTAALFQHKNMGAQVFNFAPKGFSSPKFLFIF